VLHLGLALYAEGPTDYYFLRPLLIRLCEDICTREAPQPIELSEVFSLNTLPHMQNAPRAQRVVEAARAALGAWRILFVHADGAGDPDRARRQQTDPALEVLQRELREHGIGVAVVPVRETEAWAIVDGDALRQVFGTELTDSELGLPSVRQLESVSDPKAVLSSAFLATNPTGRRRRAGPTPLLNAIGEKVSLDRLRRLSAFQALENDLKVALKELRVLR